MKWYLYYVVNQNTLRTCEGKQNFHKNIYEFSIAIDLKNALKRSNYRFHSTCAHLFLSYHLIKVPRLKIYYALFGYI